MSTSSNKPTLSGSLVSVKGQASTSAAPVRAETLYYKSMTIKVDKARYTRLKQLGVDLETTSQDLMLRGLDLLLERFS